MRKFLLACSIAASALGASAANAQTWTGGYVGVDVGYGFGQNDNDTTFRPNEASFGARNFGSSVDADGAVVGAHAGYDWQHGNWVVGVAADVAWSNIEGEERITPLVDSGGTPDPTWFQDQTAAVNGLGTLRLRVGKLIQPNTLAYATGGFAYGEVEFNTLTWFDPDPQFQYAGSDSEKRLGWTAGGGVEWATTGAWSFRAEYLYYDLGDRDFTAMPITPNPPYNVGQDFTTTGSLLRVGASFNF